MINWITYSCRDARNPEPKSDLELVTASSAKAIPRNSHPIILLTFVFPDTCIRSVWAESLSIFGIAIETP